MNGAYVAVVAVVVVVVAVVVVTPQSANEAGHDFVPALNSRQILLLSLHTPAELNKQPVHGVPSHVVVVVVKVVVGIRQSNVLAGHVPLLAGA